MHGRTVLLTLMSYAFHIAEQSEIKLVAYFGMIDNIQLRYLSRFWD